MRDAHDPVQNLVNGVETSDYADFDLYNDTWLAYRNKPGEATNER